jgi:predicted GIY-YIG superfamily endonuclease
MLSGRFNPATWKPLWRHCVSGLVAQSVEQPRMLSGLVRIGRQCNGLNVGNVGLVAQSVEQRPFKPLVLGSSPSQPTIFYALGLHLSSNSGRYYIGSTVDLNDRLSQHQRGHTHTTKRLGGNLAIAAALETATLAEARALERSLKKKKNPQLALRLLKSPQTSR